MSHHYQYVPGHQYEGIRSIHHLFQYLRVNMHNQEQRLTLDTTIHLRQVTPVS